VLGGGNEESVFLFLYILHAQVLGETSVSKFILRKPLAMLQVREEKFISI
jgi:hypothetical protein